MANMEAAPTLGDLTVLPGTRVEIVGDGRRITLRSVAITVRSGHLPGREPVGPDGGIAWDSIRRVMIEEVTHD